MRHIGAPAVQSGGGLLIPPFMDGCVHRRNNMQTSGNPALRWGLICGGATGLLAAISGIVQLAQLASGESALRLQAAGFSLLFTCVFFLVDLALFFVAGMMTARQTGTVGTGTMAGLIAGLGVGIVGAVFAVISVVAAKPGTYTAGFPTGTGPQLSQSFIVTASILSSIIRVLLFAGLGAGLGALGALAGRDASPAARANAGGFAYYPPPPPPPPGAGYPGGYSYPPSGPSGSAPSGYPPSGASGYPVPPGYPPPQGAFAPPPGYPPPPAYPPQPGTYPPPPPPPVPPAP